MAFGLAMEKTKAAEWLADIIVTTMSPFGGTVVFAGFVVLTILLTQPMSNAAAALVVLPVAISTAEKLGLNGRSFAIGVTFAASVSLIAPFEPLLCSSTGRANTASSIFFASADCSPLIIAALVIAVVPVFWPLLKPS